MVVCPKTYLSNERTVLSWLHNCIVLGGIGGVLLGCQDVQTVIGLIGPFPGGSIMVMAIFMCFYAMEAYRRRGKMLTAKTDVREIGGRLPYHDGMGPFLLGSVVLAALSMFISFSLSESDSSSAPCQAKLVLIRHAEKPANHATNLSVVGVHRAIYLSRCTIAKSLALPFGAPTSLMAFAPQEGMSTRGVDTLKPLAKAINLTIDKSVNGSDAIGFIRSLRNKLHCGATVLAAWNQDGLGGIIQHLGPSNANDFKEWPETCPSGTFVEPSWLQGSYCYDLIYHIPIYKWQNSSEFWHVGDVIPLHEGFDGNSADSCQADLRPVKGAPKINPWGHPDKRASA